MIIKLELSLEEVNQALTALQDKPFKEVHALINKICEQAKSAGATNGTVPVHAMPEAGDSHIQ